MDPKWRIVSSCTFREEDDETGFVFNADNDRLLPLNRMAAQLMRDLADGPATESEIFDKMWPHIEKAVRESVREDFRAFLLAMGEQGIVGTDDESNEPKVDRERSDRALYSPPQIESFGGGRPGSGDAEAVEKMRRRRFITVGAAALTGVVLFPPTAEAEFCANGSTPPHCTPTGNSPPAEGCPDTGNIPGMYDCETGTQPANSPCVYGKWPQGGSGDCDTGAGPRAGDCCYGHDPVSPEAWCNDGYAPNSGICEQGDGM